MSFVTTQPGALPAAVDPTTGAVVTAANAVVAGRAGV